jgi:hypothetical protein
MLVVWSICALLKEVTASLFESIDSIIAGEKHISTQLVQRKVSC